MTNIIHPHGRQNIPRSMIFGTELNEYDKSHVEKRLIKSYWAQDDLNIENISRIQSYLLFMECPCRKQIAGG